MTELRHEFYSMDTRHNGSISRSEFILALTSAQAVNDNRINLSTAHQLLCNLSGAETKELSYHVFISATMTNRIILSHERLKLVFGMLDPG